MNLWVSHPLGQCPGQTYICEWLRGDGEEEKIYIDTTSTVEVKQSLLPYLLNLSVLGFSFVFQDRAKRTQQGNLLCQTYI